MAFRNDGRNSDLMNSFPVSCLSEGGFFDPRCPLACSFRGHYSACSTLQTLSKRRCDHEDGMFSCVYLLARKPWRSGPVSEFWSVWLCQLHYMGCSRYKIKYYTLERLLPFVWCSLGMNGETQSKKEEVPRMCPNSACLKQMGIIKLNMSVTSSSPVSVLLQEDRVLLHSG